MSYHLPFLLSVRAWLPACTRAHKLVPNLPDNLTGIGRMTTLEDNTFKHAKPTPESAHYIHLNTSAFDFCTPLTLRLKLCNKLLKRNGTTSTTHIPHKQSVFHELSALAPTILSMNLRFTQDWQTTPTHALVAWNSCSFSCANEWSDNRKSLEGRTCCGSDGRAQTMQELWWGNGLIFGHSWGLTLPTSDQQAQFVVCPKLPLAKHKLTKLVLSRAWDHSVCMCAWKGRAPDLKRGGRSFWEAGVRRWDLEEPTHERHLALPKRCSSHKPWAKTCFALLVLGRGQSVCGNLPSRWCIKSCKERSMTSCISPWRSPDCWASCLPLVVQIGWQAWSSCNTCSTGSGSLSYGLLWFSLSDVLSPHKAANCMKAHGMRWDDVTYSLVLREEQGC